MIVEEIIDIPEIYVKIDKTPLVYENYEVSNRKNVRNVLTGKILKPYIREGYEIVGLCKDGKQKQYRVHVLVALHFLDNPENKRVVNHIDGNKSNNIVSNLEWATHAENTQHWNDNRLKKAVIQYDLEGNLVKRFISATEAANSNGEFNREKILQCCREILSKHQGFLWKYEIPHIKKQKEKFGENTKINLINGTDFSKYSITNDAKTFFNNVTGEKIKIFTSGDYDNVNLTSNGKGYSIYVHKIVGVVLNKFDYNKIFDHIDGNKKNNSPDNLQEVTQLQNITFACGKPVIGTDKNGVKTKYDSMNAAAKKLGFKKGSDIRSVINGKQKTAFGRTWELA